MSVLDGRPLAGVALSDDALAVVSFVVFLVVAAGVVAAALLVG